MQVEQETESSSRPAKGISRQEARSYRTTREDRRVFLRHQMYRGSKSFRKTLDVQQNHKQKKIEIRLHVKLNPVFRCYLYLVLHIWTRERLYISRIGHRVSKWSLMKRDLIVSGIIQTREPNTLTLKVMNVLVTKKNVSQH